MCTSLRSPRNACAIEALPNLSKPLRFITKPRGFVTEQRGSVTELRDWQALPSKRNTSQAASFAVVSQSGRGIEMAVILVGGTKGGSGKTTLATNIAQALAARGQDVCLLDADPQSSAARWAERRAEQHPTRPVVHCVQRNGDVRTTAADLAGRYGHVVIDAGGRDSRELRSALLAAELFLTPLRPSQLDIETLADLGEVLAATCLYNPTLRSHSVLSIAPTNPKVGEVADARGALGAAYAASMPLLTAVARDRKVYRDAVLAGLGVSELDNPLATAEMNALVDELLGAPATIASAAHADSLAQP